MLVKNLSLILGRRREKEVNPRIWACEGVGAVRACVPIVCVQVNSREVQERAAAVLGPETRAPWHSSSAHPPPPPASVSLCPPCPH